MFNSKDFLEVDLDEFCRELSPYDYMHFSIDCSSFSCLGHPGQFRNAQTTSWASTPLAEPATG